MANNVSLDKIESGPNEPSVLNDEIAWLNTTNNTLSTYNGSSWNYLNGSKVTSQVFVDFKRSDSYREDGTREFPYKTLTAAYDKAVLLKPTNDSVKIVLISGNSQATAENVSFTTGHIFLTSENSSGTHTPTFFYGSLTFTGPNASISENHFGVSNIEIIGISGTTPLTFSGTNPQRLFIKDVWVTTNGSCHGLNMTNTGTGSSVHIHDSKFSHNGSGHYHSIHIAAGTANIDGLETSGSTVGVIGVDTGTCNLINSDLSGSASYVVDVYNGGILTAGNVKITNTAANSSGIKLVESGAISVIGNCTFSVPAAGTGRAIEGVAGSILYYTNLFFLPDGVGGTTNRKINPAITYLPISASPSFA